MTTDIHPQLEGDKAWEAWVNTHLPAYTPPNSKTSVFWQRYHDLRCDLFEITGIREFSGRIAGIDGQGTTLSFDLLSRRTRGWVCTPSDIVRLKIKDSYPELRRAQQHLQQNPRYTCSLANLLLLQRYPVLFDARWVELCEADVTEAHDYWTSQGPKPLRLNTEYWWKGLSLGGVLATDFKGLYLGLCAEGLIRGDGPSIVGESK